MLKSLILCKNIETRDLWISFIFIWILILSLFGEPPGTWQHVRDGFEPFSGAFQTASGAQMRTFAPCCTGLKKLAESAICLSGP